MLFAVVCFGIYLVCTVRASWVCGLMSNTTLEELTDAEAEAPVIGHLMRRTDSLEKTLMLGKIEGKRKRGKQRMR